MRQIRAFFLCETVALPVGTQRQTNQNLRKFIAEKLEGEFGNLAVNLFQLHTCVPFSFLKRLRTQGALFDPKRPSRETRPHIFGCNSVQFAIEFHCLRLPSFSRDRQLFEVVIQASIRGRITARET